MSPPTATLADRHDASRRAAARRRSAARRRRSLFAIFGVLSLAVVVALTMPLFRKAVNEFNLPLAYQDVIRRQSAEKRLDPALVAAVIYAETKFDPRPSAVGAEGPMQIMPATAEYLARRSGATTFTTGDLRNPEVNIAYGSYYLRYLLDQYHGNVVVALAAYNGGEANVSRWLAAAQSSGHAFTARDIPFPETRAYVERVLKAQRDYRRSYATELGYS